MTVTAALDEARDHLRVIRQTMERSTQYSTLSGWSGVLIGLVALACCAATRSHRDVTDHGVLGVWVAALLAAIVVEFGCNKRRARQIGKRVISRLGAHILIAVTPGFFTAAVLTAFFLIHNLGLYVYPIWMLGYGIGICAVGLFSMRAVSILGLAFVVAGAVTLLLPPYWHILMMAASFGGYHILYGVAMARKYGW